MLSAVVLAALARFSCFFILFLPLFSPPSISSHIIPLGYSLYILRCDLACHDAGLRFLNSVPPNNSYTFCSPLPSYSASIMVAARGVAVRQPPGHLGNRADAIVNICMLCGGRLLVLEHVLGVVACQPRVGWTRRRGVHSEHFAGAQQMLTCRVLGDNRGGRTLRRERREEPVLSAALFHAALRFHGRWRHCCVQRWCAAAAPA